MKYLAQLSQTTVIGSHQSLRWNFCNICGNVAKDLQQEPSLFDKHERKALFQFLRNWSRGAEILNDEPIKRLLQANLNQLKNSQTRQNAYNKLVKEQIHVLEHADCLAAAYLLSGPMFEEDTSVFAWIDSLLNRKHLPSIAKTALENFFPNIKGNEALFVRVVDKCY